LGRRVEGNETFGPCSPNPCDLSSSFRIHSCSSFSPGEEVISIPGGFSSSPIHEEKFFAVGIGALFETDALFEGDPEGGLFIPPPFSLRSSSVSFLCVALPNFLLYFCENCSSKAVGVVLVDGQGVSAVVEVNLGEDGCGLEP
jgi:hypothetical protein